MLLQCWAIFAQLKLAVFAVVGPGPVFTNYFATNRLDFLLEEESVILLRVAVYNSTRSRM